MLRPILRQVGMVWVGTPVAPSMDLTQLHTDDFRHRCVACTQSAHAVRPFSARCCNGTRKRTRAPRSARVQRGHRHSLHALLCRLRRRRSPCIIAVTRTTRHRAPDNGAVVAPGGGCASPRRAESINSRSRGSLRCRSMMVDTGFLVGARESLNVPVFSLFGGKVSLGPTLEVIWYSNEVNRNLYRSLSTVNFLKLLLREADRLGIPEDVGISESGACRRRLRDSLAGAHHAAAITTFG